MRIIQTPAKRPPLASLEREMVIVGVAWLVVAGMCVMVANVWAAGLL